MSETVYRVDKFVVPTGARKSFWKERDARTRCSRAQPGFLQDLILEQSSGPGEFNFVTVVEWASQEAVENARAAVNETAPGNELHPAGSACPPRYKGGYRKLQTA